MQLHSPGGVATIVSPVGHATPDGFTLGSAPNF